MNSYSFGINSSLVWLLVYGIAAVAFSLYVYRHTIPPISGLMKSVLISLRSIALILLILVLFEPIMTMISSSTIESKVAVMLDKSSSIDIALKKSNESISKTITTLIDEFDSEHLNLYTFSDETLEVELGNVDSIKYDGNSTDIAQAIRNVGKKRIDENIQATILISDGIFNTGTNPKYDAELFGKPIYTIGIGDSNQKRDLIIKSMLTNEIAYLSTVVPVNVKVNTFGFKDTVVTVKLYDNGKLLEQQEVNLIPNKSQYDLIFEFNPKTEGMHKITASISKFENESTHKNNQLSQYIDVLGNKRRISIFAGASSPDLSFLLNELKKVEGIEINKFIQKKGSEFYKKPSDADIKSSELFIFIGFPNSSSPNGILNRINVELANGKPLLFYASKDVSYKKLKAFQKYMPFDLLGTNDKEFLTNVNVLETAKEHPLIKFDANVDVLTTWNKLPPLYKTETFIQAKPTAEVLAILKTNSDLMTEPVILTQNLNEQKTIAFLAYGFYRWKLMDHANANAKDNYDNVDVFSHLINSSIRWLSVKENKKFVKIKTVKKQYNANETIEFIGQVYDQSYSPVDDAEINIKIYTGKDATELRMNSLGNGRYRGELSSMPVGDHIFKANAIRNGQKLGNDNGRFTVGPTSIEFVNLQMDTELLRKIAHSSGGEFYALDQIDEVIVDIRANKNFIAKPVTKHNEFSLWDNVWMLIAALLIFSIEWFIRKRLGMV